MTIYHLQPPPAQREGGLEAAIQSLCAALEAAGAQVATELPAELAPGSVVHLHGLWQWRYGEASKRCLQSGTPYVISPHGMLEPWAWRHKWWKKWPYFLLREKRLLQRAGAVLATAEEEAGRLRARLPGARVEALPLGLTGEAGPDYEQARAQLGWVPGERVLLYLSRLHPKKGLELLLEALAALPLAGPLRLVVVGDGAPDYVQSLKKFAEARAGQLPRIDWVGPIWGDLRWPYFQGADLFCLPTYSENFGLAVLEALQVGTPVLTTSTTPWGSQLTPPRGFICNPSVASVTTALRQALAATPTDVLARTQLAAWAREHFAWPNLAPRYLALYQSLARR